MGKHTGESKTVSLEKSVVSCKQNKQIIIESDTGESDEDLEHHTERPEVTTTTELDNSRESQTT